MSLIEIIFSWLPPDMVYLLLGFITFAFIIALVKFIKR